MTGGIRLANDTHTWLNIIGLALPATATVSYTHLLYATRFLEPESLGVKLANDGLIEIVYQCRKPVSYTHLS